MLKHADTDEEIARCFSVMAELRPHVRKDDFVGLIRRMQREGYCLAYVESDGEVVGVAGYRVSTNLFLGKNLYVDDLVTAESARSQGYGHEMMTGLRNIAAEQSCEQLHLDSGTQRAQAHKFYFREGLTVTSFHFNEKL